MKNYKPSGSVAGVRFSDLVLFAIRFASVSDAWRSLIPVLTPVALEPLVRYAYRGLRKIFLYSILT